MRDLAYALRAADTHLQPAGSGTNQGIVPLPPGHTSVVVQVDPTNPAAVIHVPADHVFLQVYATGEVHGYPLVLGSPNFTQGTLTIFPAVPW